MKIPNFIRHVGSRWEDFERRMRSPSVVSNGTKVREDETEVLAGSREFTYRLQAALRGTSLLRCGLPGSPGQLSDVNQTVESHRPLPAHQQLSSGLELRRKVRHAQPALWRRRLRCANPRHRGAHTYLGDEGWRI